MELRHLRYFTAVAEIKNLSKASEVVHVTQPALSRQIKDLEEELGTQLFIRTSSGVRLTDTGRVFLRSAKQILLLADSAMREASSLGKLPTITLKIGFEKSVTGPLLFGAIGQLGRSYPTAALTVLEAMPQSLLQQLRASGLDICLITSSDSQTAPDLLSHQLSRRNLKLLVSAHHRLAAHDSVDLGQLANEPLILVNDSFQSTIVRACRRAGFEPTHLRQANSYLAMLALVAAQRGYALSPYDIDLTVTDEIRAIPLVNPISCPGVAAIWLRDKHLDDLAKAFLEILIVNSGVVSESRSIS